MYNYDEKGGLYLINVKINLIDIDNFLILNLMSLGPLKENNVSFSPSKEMRKLKIELADRTFELKKL